MAQRELLEQNNPWISIFEPNDTFPNEPFPNSSLSNATMANDLFANNLFDNDPFDNDPWTSYAFQNTNISYDWGQNRYGSDVPSVPADSNSDSIANSILDVSPFSVSPFAVAPVAGVPASRVSFATSHAETSTTMDIDAYTNPLNSGDSSSLRLPPLPLPPSPPPAWVRPLLSDWMSDFFSPPRVNTTSVMYDFPLGSNASQNHG